MALSASLPPPTFDLTSYASPASYDSMPLSRSVTSTIRGLSDAATNLRIRSIRDLAPNSYYPSRYCLDASSRPTSCSSARAFSTSTCTTSPLILPLSTCSIVDPSKSVIFAPGAGPSITNRALSTSSSDDDHSETSSISPPAVEPLPKKFKYEIAASYAAKQRKWEAANTFVYSPYTRTAYEPTWSLRKKARPKTGQDAFFVSRFSKTTNEAVAFGVADGVGGYSDSGIDSADFSHTFCEDMAEIVHQHAGSTLLGAGQLMELGYRSVTSNTNIPGGASTACLATADSTGKMEAANLGDSGYVILRSGRVHFTSPPQTHAFNTPYQLSLIPQALIDQAMKYGGGVPLSDLPRDADIRHHNLTHGDVLIFATDGLWDNLSSQEVLRLTAETMIDSKAWTLTENGFGAGVNLPALVEGFESVQAKVARAVAARAKLMSVNKKVDGPFAKEVQRTFPGESYHGGKMDDICVVCVVVLEVSPAAVDVAYDESVDDVFIRGGLPGGGGPGAPMPRL